MLSPSDDNLAGDIEASNLPQYIYLTFLILIIFIFEQNVSQIYPTELQLNLANFFDTEAPLFKLGFVYNY